MPPGQGYANAAPAEDPLTPEKQQIPVNQPLAPYGEQAELSRLSQSIQAPPPHDAGQRPEAPPIGDASVTSYGATPSPTRVPGVPDVLLEPTQRPQVDVASEPPAMPAPQMLDVQAPDEVRMAIMMAIAESPEAHPNTRAWAQAYVEIVGLGRE